MKLQRSLVGFVGLFTFYNAVLAQEASSLDITFNPGSGAGPVLSVALTTNGDVLIGGEFTGVNGQSRNYVARLKPDGGLDTGFLPGQGPNSYVESVAIDPTGKLYIGGYFGMYDGITQNGLARLRDDASLDLSWPNVVFDGDVSVIRPQQDGRLIVLGGFIHVNGVSRRNLARLNTDASVDASFNPGLRVTDGAIYAFVVQPDGNVIIAGSFTTNSPVSRQYIARVSQSGVLDSTFNAGYIPVVSGYYPVTALALQPDGKVIVSGSFTSINGYSRNGIARLNKDGSVDTSFVLPDGINNSFGSAITVHSITVLSSGKVLLAGSFAVSGMNGLVQLNSDGRVDSTFNAYVDHMAWVWDVAVQPDGRLLVGGAFGSIAGTNIYGIARLHGTSTNALNAQLLGFDLYAGMFVSGVVSNTYRVEWTTNLNTPSLWTPLANVTLQTNPQFVADPNPISGPRRFYRAVKLP